MTEPWVVICFSPLIWSKFTLHSRKWKLSLRVLRVLWGCRLSTSFGGLSQCFYHLRMCWADAFKVSQLYKMTMNKRNEALGAGNSWWCLQRGFSPASVSCHLELTLYCPKMLFLFYNWPLPATRQLRYWTSKTASLFKAVSVTPHTAIHYHSNEPATMGGKICRLIPLQQPLLSTNYSRQLIGTIAQGGLAWAATVLSAKQSANIYKLASMV